MKRLIVLAFVLLVQNSFAQKIDYKGLPQWSWHQQDSTEYYLYTPQGMKKNQKYPVVLAMHGCCGEDNHASLRNTVDPIVRMWHNFSDNTQKVPTYIIAPATDSGWQQHFENLKKIIDSLIANNNADAKRIYVCGFSMGAEGVYNIVQQYPGYFAAAITMGMSVKGDSSKLKDIPLWCNQGETDYFSQSLQQNVTAIRRLNGDANDTGATWVTGVNPRYSNFKGVGHGVQWDAASKQDLTGWAYSKINDGNIYPVVFFEDQPGRQSVDRRTKIDLKINAHDPDGSIKKVELYRNNKLEKSFKKAPYNYTLTPLRGDNIIKAVAYDDKGKTSEAEIMVMVEMKPYISTNFLKDAQVGKMYTEKLSGGGNGNIVYSIDKTKLPPGLILYPDGTLKGIPLRSSMYNLPVMLHGEIGDTVEKNLPLRITIKPGNEVLITNVVSANKTVYPISKTMLGEAPNFDCKDTLLTTTLSEINFSNLAGYNDLTYIKTDINEADTAANDFLSFDIDEDATIYIAYETLDSNYHSTIPAWLNDYKKEEGQIVAQYRYYDVYSKSFPKGKVELPAADATANGVGTGYFVMVKKE